MGKISILGVVVGAIVDIALSTISGVTTAIVAVSSNPDIASLPPEELTQQITLLMKTDSLFRTVGYALGAIASIAGGLVAASIAKRAQLLNGALSAWACVSLGLYGVFLGSDTDITKTVIGALSSPLLGMIGGYLRKPRAS